MHKKSIFINRSPLDKFIKLSSIKVITSTRSFTKTRYFSNKPEFLALEHIQSGKPTTSSVINKILLNQNIIVNNSKLEELLKVKGIELSLPIFTIPSDKEKVNLFTELVGKSKYKGYSGVYIFIHKETNHKYVGSSNLLRRRMDYYFKGKFSLMGKFLPLLCKEGLKAFKLIIFKLDINKFKSGDSLVLEQYYLLNKEFNLNHLKVVNAGSSKGETIYIYDLKGTILYYKAKSKIELKRVLNIHTETINKYVDSNVPYLRNYLLLSYPIPTALISDVSLETLRNIMQKERQDMYKLGTRRTISVELEIKEGNLFVDSWGDTLKFSSLTLCIEYLREKGLTIKRDTLSKYIKREKVFHNFLCKYSNKALPDDFEKVGLILDEYKKISAKTSLNSLKVNRKNRPIIVKGNIFDAELGKFVHQKEFKSIIDTIRFFNSLNLKLDRKTLYIRLKDGKEYKSYTFAYQ